MNTAVFPSNGGTEEKLKSYWNRPGGKVGTFVALALLGVAGYFLFPIATTIVWNTINLGIACVVAFLLYMFIVSDTTRKLLQGVFYLYEILVKKLLGVVWTIDPFIIAEDYIKDIKAERTKLYDKSTEVDAQKEALDAKIAEKQAEKKKQLGIAVAAQKSGETMELGNATRQITRLDEYVKALTPIRDNLNKISTYLTQVYKNSKYMIEDMENDLSLKKDLYSSVTKGNNALQSAMKIFAGDPQKKLMVEQSMDYLKEDVATKLASMKKAISYTGEFMKSIDLENASYQEQGLQMLQEYSPELFTYKQEDGTTVTLSAAQANPTLGRTNNANYDTLLN